MNVEYYYCNSCFFEDNDLFVAYNRSVANGTLYLCPSCGEENFVDVDEEEEEY